MEVVVQLAFLLGLLSEEDLEVGVEDDPAQIQNEIAVAASLRFHLVAQPDQLKVENSDIALRIVQESLQDAVGTHQVLIEEVGIGLGVGEQF